MVLDDACGRVETHMLRTIALDPSTLSALGKKCRAFKVGREAPMDSTYALGRQ